MPLCKANTTNKPKRFGAFFMSIDAGTRNKWFWDHYENAAEETIAFLREDGVDLTNKRIADIGSGDGIIDLAITRKAKPSQLVGFDLNLTNSDYLSRLSSSQGQSGELPKELQFIQSDTLSIPAESSSFDVVISWSAYEHISNTDHISKEIYRILKEDGTVFIQVWPLFYSEHGSHLNEYFPGFTHLRKEVDEINALVLNSASNHDWAKIMLVEYASLNRKRLDEIHASLRIAGLAVRRAELLTHTVRLTPDLSMKYPLSDLLIAGFKITACRA
jgi:ubiquinone/menaquinone biosynthesis C-methylase UbiE